MSLSSATGEAGGEDPPLGAGDFAAWLGRIEQAVRGRDESAVPCDGCTACCRSGQFVPVGPDELDTLAHLPPELLVPAPRLPDGHRVLVTTEDGHCPMLVDGRCTIYEHRPRACRAYDCRIFAATGVDVGPEQRKVARRVARWEFTFDSDAARAERDACRAAATYLDRRRHRWTEIPSGPTRVAAAAVAVHHLFWEEGDRGQPASVSSEPFRPDELRRRLARVTGPPAGSRRQPGTEP